MELEVFLWFIFGLERLFKQAVRRAIPELDELRARPAEVLAKNEICIGPSRRYVIGPLVGLLVGTMFSLVLLGWRIEQVGEGPIPVEEKRLRLVLYIAPVVFASALFICFLRGGELTMAREGVSFRLRRVMVFCPWPVFGSAGDVATSGPLAVFIPVPREAIELLQEEVDGDLVAHGKRVNAKQLRPTRNRCGLVIRDLYAVRVDQVARLLIEIGSKLAPPTPSDISFDS